MTNDDFSLELLVERSPAQVFAAVRDVWAWWGAGIEGSTEQVGDVFRYRHGDIHASTQRLTELAANEKLVWTVTEARLTFVEPTDEWVGTRLVFVIAPEGERTRLRFTHEGLKKSVACFDACSKGWGYYVGESLQKLLTTGAGTPDRSAR